MKKPFFIFLLFIATLSFAQGKMKVTVTDELTKEPISSSQCILTTHPDSIQTFSPDTNGNFVFNRVPGRYKIIVQCPGYMTKTITGVLVYEGKTAYVNLPLRPDREFTREEQYKLGLLPEKKLTKKERKNLGLKSK